MLILKRRKAARHKYFTRSSASKTIVERSFKVKLSSTARKSKCNRTTFIQEEPCFKMPELENCIECSKVKKKRSKNMQNTCRFTHFRLLKRNKCDQVSTAGFPNPHKDASQEDMELWSVKPKEPQHTYDFELSVYLLIMVGRMFCDIFRKEKSVLDLQKVKGKSIAWKRVVPGVREMCDVCQTTLFNFQWVCGKCGFVVCIDCYEVNGNKTVFNKSFCTNRKAHESKKLLLTQMIPGHCLEAMNTKCLNIMESKGILQESGSSRIEEAYKNFVKKMLRNQVNNAEFSGNVDKKMLQSRTVTQSLLCDSKLLMLTDSNSMQNYMIFQDHWQRGLPVIITNVCKNLDKKLWSPESFSKEFGNTRTELLNCITRETISNKKMNSFWKGFHSYSERPKDKKGKHMVLMLKDWPTGEDFATKLRSRFLDIKKNLPLSEYTCPSGELNLACRLPDCFVRPDLGPKMYAAYGSASSPKNGTTNLHLDISDAVNILAYVGMPKDAIKKNFTEEVQKAISEADCDQQILKRAEESKDLAGALWHIFQPSDTEKIRNFLLKLEHEKGHHMDSTDDPIHDQSWYMDKKLLDRLRKEYGVKGCTLLQHHGDAIFIPAGSPHQVWNLYDCIKIALDFVSPENVSHCLRLTDEFRKLSDTHSNHEDKLQIKNILFHTVKHSLSLLEAEESNTD